MNDPMSIFFFPRREQHTRDRERDEMADARTGQTICV